MEKCVYCGKEIPDGGVCGCKEAMEAAANGNAARTVDAGEVSDKKSKKKKKKDGEKSGKKIKVILILCLIAALVIVILGFMLHWSIERKKPVKNYVKGLNQSNAEMMVNAMYTTDFIDKTAGDLRAQGKIWEDNIRDYGKAIQDEKESSGFKKAKVKFLGKEKVKGDMLSSLKGYYKVFSGQDIKKAYKFDVEFTVKAKKGKNVKTGVIYVVKTKDEGWKFCPLGDTTGLSDYFTL